jgi:hypothetical protein
MHEVRSSSKEYETPTLTRHGAFEKLTQGESSGTKLDQDFPQGTPFGSLTFS